MIPSIPSQTAEAVCWMRAAEHLRPEADRIVDDPYARVFLSTPYRLALRPLSRRPEAVDPLMVLGVTAAVLARHRFIDDAIRAALPVDQVVLLGAGYDARLYRLDLGSARRFEVDHPATAARKARRAAEYGGDLPPVDIVRVSVDFAVESLDAKLREAGFAPDRRTFWAWEGVSMYLPRAAAEGTLHAIRALSGPGSRLAMDFLAPASPTGVIGRLRGATPQFLGMVGEPVRFEIAREGARDLLASCGWRVIDEGDPAELGRRYVRGRRRLMPGMYVVTAEAV